MSNADRDEFLDGLRQMVGDAIEACRSPCVIEALSAYVKWRHEDWTALAALGKAYQELGRMSDALDALTRAREAAPDDKSWSVFIDLASLHSQWENHGEAEAWFSRALESDQAEQFGWLWILRGANLAQQEEFERAEYCHRRATTLENADRDEAYLNLGYVLRAKGKYAEAAEAFESALAITEDYEEARRALDSLVGVEEAMELARVAPMIFR